MANGAPVAQGETLRTKGLDDRVVTLEVTQRLKHELEEFGLALMLFDKLSLLEALELDQPLLDRLLEIARVNAFKGLLQPAWYLLVEATGHGPQLVEWLQIILDLLQLTEAGLGLSEKRLSLIDLDGEHAHFVKRRLQLLCLVESGVNKCRVELFLGPAGFIGEPIERDVQGYLVGYNDCLLLLLFSTS